MASISVNIVPLVLMLKFVTIVNVVIVCVKHWYDFVLIRHMSVNANVLDGLTFREHCNLNANC